MHDRKHDFKEILITGVRSLVVQVDVFRNAFEKYGPMEEGLEPNEALERLKAKREEYQVIKMLYDQLHAGEALFGLPHQSYEKLVKTSEQIQLLDKLYGLY